MGRLKQKLGNISVLQGDELEPEYLEEPTLEDHTVAQLHKSIATLIILKPYGYVGELKDAAEQLNNLIGRLEKPF